MSTHVSWTPTIGRSPVSTRRETRWPPCPVRRTPAAATRSVRRCCSVTVRRCTWPVAMTGVLDGKDRRRHRNQPRRRGRASRTNYCARGRPSSAAHDRRWTPFRASTPNPEWASRSSQLVCDQGDYHSIDYLRRRRHRHPRARRHSGQQRRRHRSRRRTSRDIPELVPRIQGAPRSDDDYRAHRAVPRVRRPDEPDQSALVRHPRLPADVHPGRHRLHHQHLQRRRASGRITDAGLLRCGQERAQPSHPLAGRRSGGRRSASTASRWARR